MATATQELTIEEKLTQLHDLQTIYSEIDEIHILKGELPMEVADLEDDIEGLKIRVNKIDADITNKEDEISSRRNSIVESKALVEKYNRQLDNVKNNREYDALTKEIELQTLEVQLNEKKIGDAEIEIEGLKELLEETKEKAESKEKDLEVKKVELEKIISKTEKQEVKLTNKATRLAKKIEPRLINAFNRIRGSYKNGLAVVSVERDSCGGCFGKVPPQTQMEIRQRKKIILCEHCGRLLVDTNKEEE